MRQNNYAEAADYWQHFLQRYPITDLSPSAYYLWARSLEKTDHCEVAIGHYKSAYTLWGVRPSKDKARTKLRIASCYLKNGQSDLAIAELKEIEKQRKLLSWQDYYIERNSLLAIAYAQEGNAKQSATHYQLVDKYIQQALKSKREIEESWLSDLYMDLATNLDAFSGDSLSTEVMKMKQKYLSRVIEKADSEKAEQAAAKLKEMYTKAWDHLLQKEPKNRNYKSNMAYQKLRSLAEAIQAVVLSFDLEFSPVYEETPSLRELKKWVVEYQVQLQNWINQPLPSQEISEEAKSRQAPKEKGKLVPVKKDPNL